MIARIIGHKSLNILSFLNVSKYLVNSFNTSAQFFLQYYNIHLLQVASVITKWKSNENYSYGYVRAEVLAGFINGLFLIFISFFIFSEAVERLVEPPEVKHERLLPVSIAGFLVNVVGIVVFQHGGKSRTLKNWWGQNSITQQ